MHAIEEKRRQRLIQDLRLLVMCELRLARRQNGEQAAFRYGKVAAYNEMVLKLQRFNSCQAS